MKDKKKTSELFEGVNSTLHQSFVGAVERDKEPKKISACCNAEVATANSGLVGETNYYICTKCHNDCDVIAKPKELDRSFGEIQYGMNKINSKLLENSTLVKPKELEWEKEFDKLATGKEFNFHYDIPRIKDFIQQILTQQRTELLEEIKKMEVGEFEGWDFFFGSKKQCCPGDDYADVYNKALKDVIKKIKNL